MEREHKLFQAHQEAELAKATVIVCGGRNYADFDRVFAALDAAAARRAIRRIRHGGAPGADSLADAWARGRRVEVVVYRADWIGLGPKAGPLRNQQMADAGGVGLIAFPGGHGTEDMVRRAVAAGIPVWRPYPTER